MSVPEKVKYVLIICSNDYYPERIKSYAHTKIYMKMFIVLLVIIALN